MKRIEVYVFSPADETSRKGMQDINKMKLLHSWFGMPPQSAQKLWAEAYPNCWQRGMHAIEAPVSKGAMFWARTALKIKKGGSKKRFPTAIDVEVK